MTARAATDVSLTLDRTDHRSLPVQVADALRAQITSGVLAPGESVPSTRHLSERLGISRGTVVTAYDQLLGEGYLQASQGQPTVVHPALNKIHPRFSGQPKSAGTQNSFRNTEGAAALTDTDTQSLVDLRPGQPDSSRVAGPAWRAAWRHAAAQPTDLSPAPIGLDLLREAVAEHLRLMRALPVPASSLVVTAGAREGLTLLLAATARRNGRAQLRVGLEAPGHPGLREVPSTHGHTVVPCPVDRNGLRVDQLPTGRNAPDVLVVTPSHQYPLGGSLTLERRLELLDWAHRWDVLLVEDDFDSELRYVGSPLPTLSALDSVGEQVALLGTFSTLLTPSLATGYVTAPENLLPAVRHIRETLGVPVAAITQFALAHLLSSGQVRRHTQRMRTEYRRRRDAVQAVFSEATHAQLVPMHGGIDAVIHTDRPEQDVIAACRERGLVVGGQSEYWTWGDGKVSPTGDRGHGVVVGFARPDDSDFQRVLPVLLEVCDRPE